MEKWIGIVLYLLVLIGIGVAASRRMNNIKDYFAAGKSLGFFSVAFSARATGESAWLLLGLTGMGAAIGIKAFWVVLGEVLGVAGAWLLMSRRFKRLTDRYDSITMPDYLEERFRDKSHAIRIISALTLMIFVSIYVSAQIDATGKAFEDFLDWNYYTGIAVGFAVVVTYITSGGFLAVAWSDVFQGALMFLGLVFLPVVALSNLGGWSAMMDGLGRIDPVLLSAAGEGGWTSGNIAEIIGLSLIGLGFLGSPQIFVRFISLRDESEITKGTAVALIWTLLADSGAVLIGMIGRVALTGATGDMMDFGGKESVLPALVEHTFPLFLVGLYIAIVLSAIMSTIDSLLVVASSAVVRDWYQKFQYPMSIMDSVRVAMGNREVQERYRNTNAPEISPEKLVFLSRIVTFTLAIASLGIALAVAISTPERTVFWFVIFGWSGISATFCPVVILSLFWSKLTRRGAITAMLTGFLGVPFYKFLAPKLGGVGFIFDKMGELPPAFATAFLAAVVVSLLDKQGQTELEGVAEDLKAAAE